MGGFSVTHLVILWIMVGAPVGLVIGFIKNRPGYGLVLGTLLGPVGWMIAGFARGRFRECPACSAPIPQQAKFCPKCGVSVEKAERRTARSALKGEMR